MTKIGLNAMSFRGGRVGAPAAACLLWLCAGLSIGCGESAPPPEIAEARQMLQGNRPQAALDLLHSDRSPESHYLRTLALERLESRDAAALEIKQAVEKVPDNPKYKGLQLRIELFAGKEETADRLIELSKASPPSAALSLFTTFAYEGKGLRRQAEAKIDEATQLRDEAIKSLSTAVTLSADAPELQPEMLVFARRFQLGDAAARVLDQLEKSLPEGVDLLEDKISVAFMNNRADQALELARTAYERRQQDEASAMLYASVLVSSPSTAENDETFKALQEKFPENPVIITRHAIYLTGTGRVQEACDMLNSALNRIEEADHRTQLVYAAIDLPIEVGHADLAEQQMKFYDLLGIDPLLKNYFEGRIAYIRRDYETAAKKMMEIVESQKDAPVSARALSAEALEWVRRIIADKLVADEMRNAAESVKKGVEGAGDEKKATDDKPEVKDSPKEGDSPAGEKKPEKKPGG